MVRADKAVARGWADEGLVGGDLVEGKLRAETFVFELFE